MYSLLFSEYIPHPVLDVHLYLALALAGPPPSLAVHISESAICIRHMSLPRCPVLCPLTPRSPNPLPPCSFCSGRVVIVWSRPLARRKSTQLTVIAFYRLSLDKVFHRPRAFPPRPLHFPRTRTFLVIAAIVVVAAAIVVICRFTRFLYFNLIL